MPVPAPTVRSSTSRSTPCSSCLAPFAPHLAAEAYERRRGDNVHTRPWPVADLRLLTDETSTMIVQVNGKLRDRIEVARDISEDAAVAAALASAKVREALGRRFAGAASLPVLQGSSTSSPEPVQETAGFGE